MKRWRRHQRHQDEEGSTQAEHRTAGREVQPSAQEATDVVGPQVPGRLQTLSQLLARHGGVVPPASLRAHCGSRAEQAPSRAEPRRPAPRRPPLAAAGAATTARPAGELGQAQLDLP